MCQGCLFTSVATPLYLYFAVLLCQGELLMQSWFFIFGTALEQIAVRHRLIQ